MRVLVIVFLSLTAYEGCYGQNALNINETKTVHRRLTERIGNSSIEMLFHTSRLQADDQNLIMSPITVWTALAIIAEGAELNTREQINIALRLPHQAKVNNTRHDLRNIMQWLKVKTQTVELAKVNTIFVDRLRLPNEDFQDIAKNYYDTEMLSLDFQDSDQAANLLNNAISNITHGLIPKIVDASYFKDAQMILTSAVYFKGQWTVPFNASSTSRLPFYNSEGNKIGDVNMMYNRYTYPFSNIKQLQARVIELPYGKENRLSMVIMLPNPGVSLENMFFNFKSMTLDSFFEELRLSKEEFSDDEVDCFIPRFKIKSDIDMTPILRDWMGIQDLFDPDKARLPLLARTPLFVSKIIHKAEIELSEEGTTGAAVTVAEFSNRIGTVRFEANRPFAYIIVEKVTNSIVFGGVYKKPSLY